MRSRVSGSQDYKLYECGWCGQFCVNSTTAHKRARHPQRFKAWAERKKMEADGKKDFMERLGMEPNAQEISASLPSPLRMDAEADPKPVATPIPAASDSEDDDVQLLFEARPIIQTPDLPVLPELKVKTEWREEAVVKLEELQLPAHRARKRSCSGSDSDCSGASNATLPVQYKINQEPRSGSEDEGKRRTFVFQRLFQYHPNPFLACEVKVQLKSAPFPQLNLTRFVPSSPTKADLVLASSPTPAKDPEEPAEGKKPKLSMSPAESRPGGSARVPRLRFQKCPCCDYWSKLGLRLEAHFTKVHIRPIKEEILLKMQEKMRRKLMRDDESD